MTWTAQFEVTDVDGGTITAKASALSGSGDSPEVGTLTQNTERVDRMTLVMEMAEGVEPTLQVGDQLPAHGHFTS